MLPLFQSRFSPTSSSPKANISILGIGQKKRKYPSVLGSGLWFVLKIPTIKSAMTSFPFFIVFLFQSIYLRREKIGNYFSLSRETKPFILRLNLRVEIALDHQSVQHMKELTRTHCTHIFLAYVIDSLIPLFEICRHRMMYGDDIILPLSGY